MSAHKLKAHLAASIEPKADRQAPPPGEVEL
jgi:hypothetical protein